MLVFLTKKDKFFQKSFMIRRKIMNFEDVREIIETHNKECWDEVFIASEIYFKDFNTVIIESIPFNVSQSAKRLIGMRLNLPAPYIDRCPPELQAQNLNYWMNNVNANEKLFCRFVGNDLRCLFTERYVPMDNLDIVNTLEVQSDKCCYFRFDRDVMQLSILHEDKKFISDFGETFIPGVVISNSEVGLKSLEMSVFYYMPEHDCGIIVTDVGHYHFRHTSKRGLNRMPEVYAELNHISREDFNKFDLVNDIMFTEPETALREFGKKFVLSKSEISQIYSKWDKTGNVWSIMHAISKAAEDFNKNVARLLTFQKVSGEILNTIKV